MLERQEITKALEIFTEEILRGGLDVRDTSQETWDLPRMEITRPKIKKFLGIIPYKTFERVGRINSWPDLFFGYQSPLSVSVYEPSVKNTIERAVQSAEKAGIQTEINLSYI